MPRNCVIRLQKGLACWNRIFCCQHTTPSILQVVSLWMISLLSLADFLTSWLTSLDDFLTFAWWLPYMTNGGASVHQSIYMHSAAGVKFSIYLIYDHSFSVGNGGGASVCSTRVHVSPPLSNFEFTFVYPNTMTPIGGFPTWASVKERDWSQVIYSDVRNKPGHPSSLESRSLGWFGSDDSSATVKLEVMQLHSRHRDTTATVQGILEDLRATTHVTLAHQHRHYYHTTMKKWNKRHRHWVMDAWLSSPTKQICHTNSLSLLAGLKYWGRKILGTLRTGGQTVLGMLRTGVKQSWESSTQGSNQRRR